MANKKKRVLYPRGRVGKKRNLHFSMNFWANFTDILKTPLDKIGNIFEGVYLLLALER